MWRPVISTLAKAGEKSWISQSSLAFVRDSRQGFLGNRSLRCSTSCIHAVVATLEMTFREFLKS